MTRRFLAIYGPATIDEVARWIGLEPSVARRLFGALGDEIVEVEVEGWRGLEAEVSRLGSFLETEVQLIYS